MVVAAIENGGILFPDQEELVVSRERLADPRPIMVAVTGTPQKQEMLKYVGRPGMANSEVSGFEVFTRIDVNEIPGMTGGEVVLFKAQDFASKLWKYLIGADDRHKEAILNGRVFVLCDTKMGISQLGQAYSPVHKLKTLLDGEYNAARLKVDLPSWWVSQFTKLSDGLDVSVRWSTGVAVVKFVRDSATDKHRGEYVLVYADSKASIVLPSSLHSNVDFWRDYVRYGLERRDENPMIHWGASMGILVEDIVAMVQGNRFPGVTIEDLNLLLPPLPKGMNAFDYLDQHAKGAPTDVVSAVLNGGIKRMTKGTYWLGTREPRVS